jgi:hypothetical protein
VVHSTHAAVADFEYCPFAHLRHCSAPPVENWPALQAKQSTRAPVEAAAHAVPRAHVQSLHFGAPAGENVPAGHIAQSAAPPRLEVPALHDSQSEEGPVEPAAHALPALQAQLVHLSVPPGEKEPAAHVGHDDAPASGTYFPAGQAVHWAVFPAGEN